jgi:predicted nucleotidyltransferase
MVRSITIFDYKGLTQEVIDSKEIRRALQRSAGEQLQYLTELIELSLLFSKNSTLLKGKNFMATSLYQTVLAFFQKLNEHETAYLLVGGFAVNAYGFARNTGDLDLWVYDTHVNRVALGKVCVEMGIAGGELLAGMDWVPGWTGFHLPNGFKVEIMSHLAAFTKDDFQECFSRAERIEIQGITIPVIHINDLLKEKQTTSRPKDREDIEQLRRIKEERS